MPDGHPSPRLNKLGHAFGKDFAWAQRIAAEEFPHGETELDPASAAVHIAHISAVGAMNGR
jgi:hypothetical protein